MVTLPLRSRGLRFLVIVTVLFVAEQMPSSLVIVHLKVFAPYPSPETAERGLFGSATVPDPLTSDHVPVPPLVAALAASTVLSVSQKACAGPALAAAGEISLLIVYIADAESHPPWFEKTDHRNLLSPCHSPDTVDVGLVMVVIVGSLCAVTCLTTILSNR